MPIYLKCEYCGGVFLCFVYSANYGNNFFFFLKSCLITRNLVESICIQWLNCVLIWFWCFSVNNLIYEIWIKTPFLYLCKLKSFRKYFIKEKNLHDSTVVWICQFCVKMLNERNFFKFINLWYWPPPLVCFMKNPSISYSWKV
mgnify:CR=1 FL=1